MAEECGFIDQSAEIYIPRCLKGSFADLDSELYWESVMQERNELLTGTLKVFAFFFIIHISIFIKAKYYFSTLMVQCTVMIYLMNSKNIILLSLEKLSVGW